jgi:head-tail adaptor
MRVPNLNRRLVLERPVTVPDGAGGFAESWVIAGVLWAEVVPGAGREVAGEEITLASTAYRVTVRGAPVGSPARPLAGSRLRDGTRLFTVLAVTERDPQGRHLVCSAREEVPA